MEETNRGTDDRSKLRISGGESLRETFRGQLSPRGKSRVEARPSQEKDRKEGGLELSYQSDVPK